MRITKWRYLIWILALLIGAVSLVGCGEKETIQVTITEIIDAETGELVKADIYVNDEMVARGVTTDTFLVLVPGTVEVRHPDYEIWALGINGKTDRTLMGPVELTPKLKTWDG
jgi:hypothetical protein